MNERQRAALTELFNPQTYAEAVDRLNRLRALRQHGDGVLSAVILAVDR